MSEQTNPDFDDFATLFWRLGSMTSPSQLQGYLMGQLSVGAPLSEADWLEQAWELIAGVEPGTDEDNALLNELLARTQAVFAEASLEGQLLLPDDDLELSQRVECLGFWCQGFLSGFTLAAKQKQADQGQQQYSKEVSEALSDFASIAQIGLSDDDAVEEQNESDFFEVLEYVRLAVMTIYFDCLPQDDTTEGGEPADAREQREQELQKQSKQGAAGLFNKKQLH